MRPRYVIPEEMITFVTSYRADGIIKHSNMRYIKKHDMNRMMIPIKKVLPFIFLASLFTGTAQRFSVEGGDGLAYTYLEEYPSTSGLNAVIVVYGTAGKNLRFDGPNTSAITWYTFDDVVNPLPNTTQTAHYSTLPLTQSECGYVAVQNGTPYYVWIIDYIKHPLVLSSVSVVEDTPSCDVTTLRIEGEGDEMVYYAFNSMLPREVSRYITISYNTLQWNEDALLYEETPRTETLDQFSASYPVTAPLCNTIFTVEGDRFLQAWGLPLQSVSSTEYVTYAVDAQATATQTYREAENEIDRKPESLGGSAPVEIEFNAYYTDAVTHVEWQFSQNQDFSNITRQYNDDLLRYTFREEGTFYVRLVAVSNNETCVCEGEPFVITIGTSSLEMPNAFSPGTIDGKNDEWKVAYKSIVEFRCWIFDKWGVQMYYSENPGEGWDGKHGGKLVSPGVYYYVIEARGADGVEYKRNGHINILRSRNNKKNQQ